MPKMTSGSARPWHPGMTTASKEDIQHMRPKQRNKYRRLGFTWAEVKKIDRAIGLGKSTLILKTTAGEVTLELPPRWH
ncbi:hypothetical protein OHB49_00565 [Streptomyces sp. NBC_01717]|uniref:hypothetical protein n=1 Tax=Streptomyces sp. NBC_01717 TaxID=2975918 RepID=UPI002E35C905|nr:hypothetical protein [Streptomyces sp. NBC_01717]